jgi:hypothetical protein
VDKTDLSLILSAFSALAIVIGPIAALVIAGFIAGLLLGQRRRLPRDRANDDVPYGALLLTLADKLRDAGRSSPTC